MTKVERVVFNINHDLMKKQREWLLEQSAKGSDEAEGLTIMIDSILDAAWDDGILPETVGSLIDVTA